jgi:hypothetical protein
MGIRLTLDVTAVLDNITSAGAKGGDAVTSAAGQAGSAVTAAAGAAASVINNVLPGSAAANVRAPATVVVAGILAGAFMLV